MKKSKLSTMLFASMLAIMETGKTMANPFESTGNSATKVTQNTYKPKQFESKSKLKKRNGSKKPRSKRK